MPRRLPLIVALLSILCLSAATVALLAPLPQGGALESALRPTYPNVILANGLTVLSDEMYEQVYGRQNIVGQRRRIATGLAVAGSAMLLTVPLLRRRNRSEGRDLLQPTA